MRLRDLGLALNKDYHLIEAEGEGTKEKIILCHNKKKLDAIKRRHPGLKIYFLPGIEEL